MGDPFDGAIALCGPTAVGKTELAVALAERIGAEILGIDSQQIYRDLPIGTAQPSAELRRRVPHHLIGFLPADERMTAARFAALAREIATDLCVRGRRLVLVGGTGLYFRAVLEGLFVAPSADPALRAGLLRDAEGEGGRAALHARLRALDPDTAARLSPNDLVRVVRALEVASLSGRTMSELRAAQVKHRPRVTWVGLHGPREELYRRIDRRTEALFASGLLDEARALLRRGLERGPAAHSLGFPQAFRHLRGEMDLAAAVAEAAQATRRYAKRQLTWFGANPQITWLDWSTDVEPILELAKGEHDLVDPPP
jgi:tRNA dimethylallyltransferase